MVTADQRSNDVLTPQQRRLVMSRIKGKNTKPELVVRRRLHARGLRYRLHGQDMPGKPDMVFPKYRAVVFVNGCFWHGHGCSLFRWPKTRAEFWQAKIEGNAERDHAVQRKLRADGWRVLVVWECALRGKYRRELANVVNEAETFVRLGRGCFAEIAGKDDGEDCVSYVQRADAPPGMAGEAD